MDCQSIEPGRWRLIFSEPEALFLTTVLTRLADHYREKMGDLSPALRAFWQSGASIKGTTRETKESREVLADARAELRSERLQLAERWLREFELAERRDPWVVELTATERDDFVAMLNDRRIVLGIEIGAASGKKLDPSEVMDEARRMAIMEIDVLGHFIMVTLGPQIFRP